MLISGLTADEAGEEKNVIADQDHDYQYRTMDDLYDEIANKVNHENFAGDTVPISDLVILYRNIDVDSKSVGGTEHLKQRNTCNQYVQKVVHNDDPDSEGSENNEAYSNKDLLDLVLINSDRLDFLNSPSINHKLHHKLGDLELHRSDTTKYDDIYNKEQLNRLSNFVYTANELNNSNFASSLLDYICFDGAETDYNFYMENVIKYVKHTIDQLTRISNGDYLTDKAKEKWRQVKNNKHELNDNMLLAVSSQQNDRKVTNHTTIDKCQDNDIHYLSNIMYRKVIIQIPLEVLTPFHLFNKFHLSDLLVISKSDFIDQKTRTNEKSKQMVVQLNHSVVTRQPIDDSRSIVIFETNTTSQNDNCTIAMIPLPYWQLNKSSNNGNGVKIVEIENSEHEIAENNTDNSNALNTESDNQTLKVMENSEIYTETNYSEGCDKLDKKDETSPFGSDILVGSDISNTKVSFSCTSTNDCTLSLQSVSMSCVPEETTEDMEQFPESIRKKSPIKKTRIKSPYENKSHLLEEKKRKKLLEIRERREKKKMAMDENSRIRKHKLNNIMTQHSSSVTKLSITNKSFYNSIYGHNTNIDNVTTKYKVKEINRYTSGDQASMKMLDNDEKNMNSELSCSSQENLKQSCYSDDPVTEMMNTQQSECSSVARDLFSELYSTDSGKIKCRNQKLHRTHGDTTKKPEEDGVTEILNKVTRSSHQLKSVPSNTPKENEVKECNSKILQTVEFKKSIDKIYDLMNKLHKNDVNNEIKVECKSSKAISTIDGIPSIDFASSTAYCSDSGTSLKHRLTASNNSNYSFGKGENTEERNVVDLQSDAVTSILPKVIISSKHELKSETDTLKKAKKKVTLNPFPEDSKNPLKAISQLLHELENKRKISRKTPAECRNYNKKAEAPFEDRTIARPVSLTARLKLEQSAKYDLKNEKTSKNKDNKTSVVNERTKIIQRRNDEKRSDKFPPRKLVDIINEVKEAKGEAVRGPSKFHSRLDALAQPKKSYVQAHSEDLNRRGRNLMADRLQRLAGTAASQLHDRLGGAGAKVAYKKNSVATDLPPIAKQSPHLDRDVQHRRPVGNFTVTSQTPHFESVSCHETLPCHPPELTKNKIVTVETFNNIDDEHLPITDTLRCKPPQRVVSKARIPLIPHDFDFGSVQSSLTEEESTAIGYRIHNMIANLFNSKSVVIDVTKTNDKEHSKDNIFDNSIKMLNKSNLTKKENASSVHLDYHVDLCDDKYLETAIECISHEQFEENSSENLCLKINGPIIEMEKLENALHRQISMGSFQKRLRIKKLTLTPKQSIQNVLILQSGDDGSVLLKSQISNNLFSKFDTNRREDAAVLSAMTETQLEPIMPSLPLHIVTVGYAFPKYNATYCNSRDSIPVYKHNQRVNDTSEMKNSFKKSEARQCNEIKNEKFVHAAVSSSNRLPVEVGKSQTNISQLLKSQPSADEQSNKTNLNNETNNINIDSSAVQTKSTSSLDVLVKLLNEIQNITECHINNTDRKKLTFAQNTLKIHDNVENECSRELVSMESLDKSRQLDSRESIYSLYISNDECEAISKNHTSDFIAGFKNILCGKIPKSNDKEIGVDFRQDKEVVHAFTNIPSKLFPVLPQSTHATDTFEGIISKPSSQMFLLPDHESPRTSSSLICKNKFLKILEDSSAYQISNEPKCIKRLTSAVVPANINFSQNDHKIKSKFINNQTQITNKLCIHVADRDPLFKMKRDILVTAYSLLVITVFAALSISDMLYYIL